jgi:flavodoxin I
MISMKILITYFSNTGNTEKVAYSIKDGLKSNDVDIIPVKDVDPSKIAFYDLVILGSGIYASRIDKSLLNLIKKAVPNLPSKFAYFCSHASLEFYQKPFYNLTKILAENGCKIIDEFDCIGDNIGIPLKTRMAMLDRLPEDKKKKAQEDIKKIKGRPNKEDLEQAKRFGQSLIDKL